VNYISVPAALSDATAGQAVNYHPPATDTPLSAWPADIHVIGKDILKFHSVIGNHAERPWAHHCPNKSSPTVGGKKMEQR